MQARDMITLVQFAQEHGGNIPAAEALVKTYLDGLPPSEHYFPEKSNKHVAKEYLAKREQSPKAGALGCAIQRALESAFCITRETLDLPMLKHLYGIFPTDKDSNMKIYLFGHAAMYQVAKTGDCSYRSCYAALCLFDIFKGTAIRVTLQSAPSKDHFIVMVGCKQTGYFIFDSLTNPTMVYDLAFYRKNILSTFLKAPAPAKAMDLTITAELADEYAVRFPKIETTYKELFLAPEHSVNALLNDHRYLSSLQANRISKRDWEKTIVEALASMRALGQAAQPTLTL